MKNTTIPLPPAARVGDADIAMIPISCPFCDGELNARDVERLADGYRLVCHHCGRDIQRFSENNSYAVSC
jgi:transposase-like protein